MQYKSTENKENNSVEVIPSNPPIGSIIWLHGLGADGHDFVHIVPELRLPENLPLRFVFPHAPLRPVTLNNGYVMRAWFDIASMEFDQRVDREGIESSITLLEKFIERERESGIPEEKIILAGFSQGSVMALTVGLSYKKQLGGILALSGFLPHADEILINASTANQAIPIFIGHGTDDPLIPIHLGEKTASVLKEHHYPVTWQSYKMPHTVCENEIVDISNWIKDRY